LINATGADLTSRIGVGKKPMASKSGKNLLSSQSKDSGSFAEEMSVASQAAPQRQAETARVKTQSDSSSNTPVADKSPIYDRSEPTNSSDPSGADSMPPPASKNEARPGAMSTAAEKNNATISDAQKRLNVDENGDLAPVEGEQEVPARRQAMQKFMTKMQDEFGISPESIVDAFGRMDAKSLLRPPEDSTNEFLSKFDFAPSEKGRAGDLYNQMLKTTGDAALNEKLTGSDGGLKMTVLSPRDEALQKLNEAIDQLNNSFALRDSSRLTSLSAPLDNPLKAQMAMEQMNAQLLKFEQNGRQTQGSGVMAESGAESDFDFAGTDFADEGSVDGNGIADREGQMESSVAGAGASASAFVGRKNQTTGFEGSSSDDSGRGNKRNSEKAIHGAADAAGNGKSFNFANAMGTNPSSSATSIARKVMSEGKAAATTGAGDTAAQSDDLNSVAGLGQQTPASKTAASGPAGMIIDRPTPSAQDEQANVKELIRQTQIALKKGGGEVKMDLKPEGMGQVRLKISVDNGQVNVQMLTETDAAKRLLEKGIHELRASLVAHELKVDNMKVDVGQELQKHMDSNGDQAKEQTRQFAQDMMQQFRDERQAFRQGFMENQGWRQYPRNYGNVETGRGGAASASAVASTAKNQAKRSAAGRLDLVA
jgi:flagellar hook-length control protein FliK